MESMKPPKRRLESTAATSYKRAAYCLNYRSQLWPPVSAKISSTLPENPPWWEALDVEKSGIDEVCRVLADLYNRPKAQYIPVCEEGDSSVELIKAALDKLKGSKKSDDELINCGESRKEPESKKLMSDDRTETETGGERRIKERERDRERGRERERTRNRYHERGHHSSRSHRRHHPYA